MSIKEFVRNVEDGSFVSLEDEWSLTSPNATVWGATVTSDGEVTFESGTGSGSTIPFLGLDGLAWNPTISNGGVVTVTSGDVLELDQLTASLLDEQGTEWVLYVDTLGQVNLSTSFSLSAAYRYPGLIIEWSPDTSTDMLIVYAVRLDINNRLLTA